MVDAVRAGDSLVVSSPPGTGQTQTAINTIGALVDEGKTVLVVADRRASLAELSGQLDTLGLESMLSAALRQRDPAAAQGPAGPGHRAQREVPQPQLSNLHTTLTGHRHALMDHVASLHNVRQRWGCSPYEAMQSLADLTSIQPAPATTVRLKRSVLDNIRDREELAGRLRRAAELGSFSRASTTSPWHGARLLTRKETEEAQQVARSVAEKLPLLRGRMNGVAEHAEIRLGNTFAEWGEQIDLLVAVRESLDKFTPDIFDRPVHDLISATAASAWRRERNIEMPSMQRSRLRRVAKEYVRPGVHIADLHSSLVLVQEQRAAWSGYATTQRHPAVPVRAGRNHGPVPRAGVGTGPAGPGGQAHRRRRRACTAPPYDELMERLRPAGRRYRHAGDPAGAHTARREHARARPGRAARRPGRARGPGGVGGGRTRAGLVAVGAGSHDQRRRLPRHVRRRRPAPARSGVPPRGQRPHRQRRGPAALEAVRTLARGHRGAPAAGRPAAQPAEGRPGDPRGPEPARPRSCCPCWCPCGRSAPTS